MKGHQAWMGVGVVRATLREERERRAEDVGKRFRRGIGDWRVTETRAATVHVPAQ